MAFNTSAPLVGNLSYADFVQQKPFGWTLQFPPAVSHYNFEILDPIYWQDFMVQTRNWAFYAGALYLVTIFGLQKWMEKRQPLDLRKHLIVWNLVLGLFSITVFVRSLPGTLFVLQQPNGFYTSICHKQHLDIPTAFWAFLFCVAKFVDLGDHVFTVLRKRPLHFLHWYHHLVSMIICWVLGPLLEPIVRWYVLTNSFSHSLVYPYLALKLHGTKIPKFIGKTITLIQLGEMLVGLCINVFTMYLLKTGQDCTRYPLSVNCFTSVYFSFCILFGKLYYDAVNQKQTKKKIN